MSDRPTPIDVTLVAGGKYHDIDFARLELLKLLDTHKPVCWDCATIETFRRNKPDWVIDREFTYKSLHF